MGPNEWPPALGYGTVGGKVFYIGADSGDDDAAPDISPAKGTVHIQPAVDIVKYAGPDGDNRILMARSVDGQFDAEGYLIGPDGNRGIKLPSSSSEYLNPSGWTYAVTIRIPGWRDINFNIVVPAGGYVDIASVATVPPTAGSAYIANEAIAQTAKNAALEAAQLISDGMSAIDDIRERVGNMTGFVVIDKFAEVPEGLPSGTVIARIENL